MIINMRPILFCALILLFLASAPRAALAFEWPSGATVAQQIQAIKQEISNAKALVLSSKSKKPVTAASYLAVDLSTNAVLLKKNPDKIYPIASVTKLMNAVVALENSDTQNSLTLTDKMLLPEGGSPAIFKGASISVQNLLQASLTQSVNDAAESLAYGLGKEKFLGLMNQKAKEMAMTNTVYADVYGLDKKSRSTTTDMAKLLAYIYKQHPEILDMTKNNNFWLPDQKGNLVKFQNLNDFYSLSEFIGGKSGYTPDAKQTFAALFNINKKPVAIVLLHSTDFQADAFKIINQLKK